jgi:ATP phosphoribosyltransferase regulatory subunit HisZ
MKSLNMNILDLNSIMRDAAKTLLVFQAYYQEIAYKCQKMGKLNELKTHFEGENAFLTEIFKT